MQTNTLPNARQSSNASKNGWPAATAIKVILAVAAGQLFKRLVLEEALFQEPAHHGHLRQEAIVANH